ncbi:hypothetical protein SAMN04488523_108202 [Sulfitobacter brevis]|uniref:Uncharacterized protein n=1 Tax=Sulfitobacter brevis TaxID=74348 RepID=A0A1I2BTD4_9RHOB|nr:hypothetical protein SAMN04488523_108202 [Sulfitobacter brevis]
MVESNGVIATHATTFEDQYCTTLLLAGGHTVRVQETVDEVCRTLDGFL